MTGISPNDSTHGAAHRRASRFAVAPMIDWTDTHCRFFHRQLSRHALLYTEMVVADAILYGPRDRLLGFNAVRIARAYGYDEFNLNVGCPSDRVQSGTFGACLMRTPDLVGECLAAMREAADATPVTVKCRIGVDDQDPETALDALADAAVRAEIGTIWVHARKAWLQGLSPKENRDIPPLDYARVARLKARLPDVFVGLNGGLKTLDEAEAAMTEGGLDGVMLGRAAYQTPDCLTGVDSRFYGAESGDAFDYAALIETMIAYAAGHMAAGGRLNHVTRHMVGLFSGMPGARRWRQILSGGASRPDATPELIREAFEAVDLAFDREAA